MDTNLFWISQIILIAVVSIWTILIRTIPSILTKAIEERIEHQYNHKLEETKADLQASYSTVKTSVDFLSAVQPELRSKMIESVEKLWGAVLALDKGYGNIMFLDSIMHPKEVDQALRTENDSFVWDAFRLYQDDSSLVNNINRDSALTTGMERLFVGDRLWHIYNTIYVVYGRFGFLVHNSIKQKRYLSWRDDQHFISNLKNVLLEDVINEAKEKQFGGLRTIIVHLHAEFLKEGTYVMSGSKGFSKTLSDVQAALKDETSKIMQERSSIVG